MPDYLKIARDFNRDLSGLSRTLKKGIRGAIPVRLAIESVRANLPVLAQFLEYALAMPDYPAEPSAPDSGTNGNAPPENAETPPPPSSNPTRRRAGREPTPAA